MQHMLSSMRTHIVVCYMQHAKDVLPATAPHASQRHTHHSFPTSDVCVCVCVYLYTRVFVYACMRGKLRQVGPLVRPLVRFACSFHLQCINQERTESVWKSRSGRAEELALEPLSNRS
jgi:hypothetical protein